MAMWGWSGEDVGIRILPLKNKSHIPPLCLPVHETQFTHAKLAKVAELPLVLLDMTLAMKVRGLG